MATAIYIRVSSVDQKDAIENQRKALERWSEVYAIGEKIITYEDVQSGKNMERPGFLALLAKLQSGGINRLVVWKLDRLGRRTVELLRFVQELDSLGVALVSITEGFDCSTAAGKLFLTMLAAFAEFENGQKRERSLLGIGRIQQEIKDGKRKSYGNGRKLGSLNENVENNKEAVLKLAKAQVKKSEIARITGLHRATINKLLNQQIA